MLCEQWINFGEKKKVQSLCPSSPPLTLCMSTPLAPTPQWLFLSFGDTTGPSFFHRSDLISLLPWPWSPISKTPPSAVSPLPLLVTPPLLVAEFLCRELRCLEPQPWRGTSSVLPLETAASTFPTNPTLPKLNLLSSLLKKKNPPPFFWVYNYFHSDTIFLPVFQAPHPPPRKKKKNRERSDI